MLSLDIMAEVWSGVEGFAVLPLSSPHVSEGYPKLERETENLRGK